MKIYLAAKFGEKEEMREWSERLRSEGHAITSTWLDAVHATDAEATPEVLAIGAMANLKDIDDCDILVTKSQPQGTAHTGGGRHFEFGYAIAEGFNVIVVGPKGEHVFHYLPGIEHVNDLDALVLRLRERQRCIDSFFPRSLQ